MQFSNLQYPGAEEEQARPGQASAGHQTGNLDLERTKIFSPGLTSVRDGLGNRPCLSSFFCKNNDKAIEETENLNV